MAKGASGIGGDGNIGSFMRFGTLPTSGKSLNFLKLSKSQRDDVFDRIDDGDTPEEALQYCKDNYNSWKNVNIDDLYESGVSVFKADKDGLPILENMQQVQSAATRIGDPVFSVSGKATGIGQDGEPVLSNAKGQQVSISNEKIQNRIIDTLKANYQDVSGSFDPTANPKNVYNFVDSVMYMGYEFKRPKKSWQ